MQRFKKPKKPQDEKIKKLTAEVRQQTVLNSCYLHVAITVICAFDVYGWRSKRIAKLLESYLSLMQEVADHRCTVNEMIDFAEKRTGYNIKKLVDELYIK